jgi:hypothetical protein
MAPPHEPWCNRFHVRMRIDKAAALAVLAMNTGVQGGPCCFCGQPIEATDVDPCTVQGGYGAGEMAGVVLPCSLFPRSHR